MQKLIDTIKSFNHCSEKRILPYSIYSSIKTQHILNVPIAKPLLIVVLSGTKELGKNAQSTARSGYFAFLSNKTSIDMRNIPKNQEYLALLIDFEYSDFNGLQKNLKTREDIIMGEVSPPLEKILSQFIEWSHIAPKEIWSLRKQEILHLLYLSGFDHIGSMSEASGFTHKVRDIINEDLSQDIKLTTLCLRLGVSESTLRRKLKLENTNLQKIKDQARLGLGLHLIQTTLEPIGIISGLCGYTSQSRFTDKFKQLFRITPSDLRKTRMTD
jgi:AraC-like DNA-binding protein